MGPRMIQIWWLSLVPVNNIITENQPAEAILIRAAVFDTQQPRCPNKYNKTKVVILSTLLVSAFATRIERHRVFRSLEADGGTGNDGI